MEEERGERLALRDQRRRRLGIKDPQVDRRVQHPMQGVCRLGRLHRTELSGLDAGADEVRGQLELRLVAFPAPLPKRALHSPLEAGPLRYIDPEEVTIALEVLQLGPDHR